MYPFKILNKKKYILLYINAFFYNVCIYAIPIILSDFLTIPFTIEKLTKLIFLIILFKFFERIFNIIWIMKGYSFIEYTKNNLYLSYFKRFSNMNISKINNIHTGYLKKQLDIIIDESGELLDGIMLTLNGFIIGISLFLFQVFSQSKLMFLISIIFIIIIISYNVIITKKNIIFQSTYNEKTSKYNSTLVDFFQNVKIVKNFDSLKYSIDTINKKFDNCKKPLKKVNLFKSLRFDGINGIISIMYIIILLNLLLKMKSGIDVFSYIVFYTFIFNQLSTELNDIAKLFIRYNKFKSANNQIEKLLVEEENQNKITNWNNITLKNIEFKYNNEKNNIIKIPKFSIDKKDKVSIVGESGQGKSTFLSLFCRFYNIKDEDYLLDYEPTNKVPNVAYISQETDLFDLTIKENLCLGKEISNEFLNNYLNDAGLLEWINSLEKGLDTIVGEKGVKLSTGQKQRLNIIRGILLDKDIYILDEPTSNLDSISENKIYDMINKYLKDKTCIIVTHRTKLTQICNKHYYFENKVMIEENKLS